MSMPPDYLYGLLPAIYRNLDGRDDSHRAPLQALLNVMQTNLVLLEENIEALYDNSFIDTCATWAIPYIGDLLAVPMLHQGDGDAFDLRGFVAHMLAFRRRKGTAAVIGPVARALGGWPSLAREDIDLTALTQNVNAVIADALACPDISDSDRLAALTTPFCGTRRTVASNSVGPATPQIGAIDLFLWTTRSFPVHGVSACLVRSEAGSEDAGWGFTFSPLGRDLQLFNHPRTTSYLKQASQAPDVPDRLTRLALYEDLNILRESKGAAIPSFQPMPIGLGKKYRASKYFGEHPVLSLSIDGKAVPSEKLVVADLSEWPRLPTSVPDAEGYVAIDPVLGRIALPADRSAVRVAAAYSYGFALDLGAGSYHRGEALHALLPPEIDWLAVVSQHGSASDCPSIAEAMERWMAFVRDTAASGRAKPPVGAVVVCDSATYAADLTGPSAVSAPAGSTLLLVAGTVTSTHRTTGSRPWSLDSRGLRPHIRGAVHVGAGDGAKVILDGFLIEGAIEVAPSGFAEVTIGHVTAVLPGTISDGPTSGETPTHLTLRRCVTGPLTFGSGIGSLSIETCLVNGERRAALAALRTFTSISQSTLIGTTSALALEATDTLFSARVDIVRQQIGRMVFCYVPDPASQQTRTPKRYRCQPDLALTDAGHFSGPIYDRICLSLLPVFRSLTFDQPDYGRLSEQVDPRIRTGASNGAEIGVYGALLAAQRTENVEIGLLDFLRLATRALVREAN